MKETDKRNERNEWKAMGLVALFGIAYMSLSDDLQIPANTEEKFLNSKEIMMIPDTKISSDTTTAMMDGLNSGIMLIQDFHLVNDAEDIGKKFETTFELRALPTKPSATLENK